MNIKNTFKKLINLLFSDKVILKSKRVIFMTTLYLKISQSARTSNSLEECNRQLGLVDNVAALELPAAIKDKVWCSSNLSTFDKVASAIKTGDTSSVSLAVLSITPAWLNYDAGSCLMKNDIDAVVSCVSRQRVRLC
jgi:hypothetical protein